MSPLLGALGDSAEYSYRGYIDDLPDDFSLNNLTDIQPGSSVVVGPITITGINNKVLTSVSAGASISINSGIFTSGPSFVRPNDTISILVPTTLNSDLDFLKTYTTNLTIGKLQKEFLVTTKSLDRTPDDFILNNFTNQELNVVKTSNTVTISGLDTSWYVGASITLGIGSFSKNGGPAGTSSTITNGDTISVVLAGPSDYSKTNTTELTVGTYKKTFSVSTRPADTTVDQFSFTNYTNVAISSSFDSNSITLSGADNHTDSAPVPLTADISGGFLKVERGTALIRDFSASPTTVYNGDTLTLRVNSSPEYSASTSAILTITGANTPIGVTSSFTVTTRPPISDTIPRQFSIVDITQQARNVPVISSPIVLTEMTDNPTGVATAYLTNNVDNAQFRVTRNGLVVRDFSTNPYSVLNGDSIDLRITTSPASNGTVSTRFNVDGVDNNDINNILFRTISDSWVVQSAIRNCTLTAPSLTNVNGVEPSTLHSVTFTPTSYDSDCGVTVSTSNANSYLSVNGVIGNNLQVLPGVTCTVFMTAGSFSQTRTTTITLTSSATGGSVTSNWSVTTRAITTPTITLTASPQNLTCGQSTTLTWTSTNAVLITTDGFSGVTTSGTLSVGPITRSRTFSATVTSSDGATATSTATVASQTTAAVSLSASSTFVPYRGSVTLAWNSANASSVVSNFGATGTFGSITLNGLTSSQQYTIYAISNGGCDNSSTASVFVSVAPCVPTNTTVGLNQVSNIAMNYRLANAGSGFDYYFVDASGSGLNVFARVATSTPRSSIYDGNGLSSGGVVATFTFPSNIYSVYGYVVGGGGGGGGGGPQLSGGGGGGGGRAYGNISGFPGKTLTIRYGSPPAGSGANAAGNTPNNGGVGSFAGQGPGGVIQDGATGADILRGRGGGGGGRNIGGVGGGNSPGNQWFSMPANVNTTGQGGTDAGNDGSGPFGASGGSNWRRGGDGGGRSQVGNSGQGSYVQINWNETSDGVNHATLISAINNQFRSSFNRPPTISEMNFYANRYSVTINGTRPYQNISDMQNAIANSGLTRSSTGAVDECGNTW